MEYGVQLSFKQEKYMVALGGKCNKTAGSRCKVVRVLLIVLASLRSWASLDLSRIRVHGAGG